MERKDEIVGWINENQSKSFICRELKCKQNTLNQYLKILYIEYKGNQGSKGKPSPFRNHVSFYLNKITFIISHKLKNKLIEDGIKDKRCEICGLDKWNDKEIPLELHHLDGNKKNNEICNLQILCPNCHAQTSNFCSKNIESYKNRLVK